MKYPALILLVALAGCATAPAPKLATGSASDAANSAKWKPLENLTGEPLVAALISQGDPQIAETHERRRNMRLEIAALKIEAQTDPAKQGDYEAKKSWEDQLTAELHAQALERKMILWKECRAK